MPRAPNPQKGKAKKLWRKGKNATEIAKELGIPEGTARRWKSEWEKENERSKQTSTDETSARNKRGAPMGSQNAVGNSGGGAPVGNENNLKHGIYRRMVWRRCDKEMIAAMQDMPHDEEEQLIIQLESLSQLEFDCNRAIERYQQQYSSGMAPSRIVRTTEGDKLSTTTTADTTIEIILRLEHELINIQRAKTRCIELLGNIRTTRKLNGIADTGEEETVTVYSLPNNGRNNG